MSKVWPLKELGCRISELPKSTVPAGAAEEGGAYPFYCSSPNARQIGFAISETPSILMGTGGVANVHLGLGAHSYSTDTWAFTVTDNETNIEFLFHQLEHKLPKIDYAGFEGSGLRHLQKKYIRELKLPLAPLQEQSYIVKILQALDTTIQQTEAIIAKLESVKLGLLHDLLTRGIDVSGHLRPPQSEAPHLYKESLLGWIPKEWKVAQIEQILARDEPAMRSGPFGSALLKHELVESGVPLLGIDNVHTELFASDFKRHVTLEKFRELSRYAVRPSDLMITIMGTVGRCCLVPEDIGLALSSKHVWTISLDQEKYSPYLAMLQVNYSPWVAEQISKDQQGGTMMAIRSETLRNLVLPVPPLSEQKNIEMKLRGISKRILHETATQTKAQLQKSGLMDDLLTGRLRVTPLLQQEVKSCTGQ